MSFHGTVKIWTQVFHTKVWSLDPGSIPVTCSNIPSCLHCTPMTEWLKRADFYPPKQYFMTITKHLFDYPWSPTAPYCSEVPSSGRGIPDSSNNPLGPLQICNISCHHNFILYRQAIKERREILLFLNSINNHIKQIVLQPMLGPSGSQGTGTMHTIRHKQKEL